MGKLYVSVSSQLENRYLNSIAEGMKLTIDEVQRDALEDLQDKILMNIENTKSDSDNSLLNEYSTADYINIEDYLEIRGDEVGFFVDGTEEGDIIYNNEFGGTIYVSEEMRGWGRMIAKMENEGKKGDDRIAPPFSNIDRFYVPSRGFLRNAFEDFKTESKLYEICRSYVSDWLDDSSSKYYEDDEGANIVTFERSGRTQARRQAPKGGMYVNGRFYKGGQYLPKESYHRQAPRGGTNLGGKFYKGGTFLPRM